LHLEQEIRQCTICAEHLPLGPKPILSIHPHSKIAIISQAPGRLAHESGIPWDDPSGERLREWLGVDKTTFYQAANFAIIPMGFCYPGKGKTGDLPPRKECAPQWHHTILSMLPQIQLTLTIGQYAQKAYLGESRRKNLTETVLHFENYLPAYLPLPHPSPLNARWRKKNPWFREAVLPVLRKWIKEILEEPIK
jgi:uracil-DNA glycosylase